MRRYAKDECNVLNLAVEMNDLAGVKALLLKYPSHVNLALEDGRTPLHTAIVKNNVEMMKILLRHKANVNRDPSSRGTETPSPLWSAMLQRQRQAAELLIRSGADVNERFGSTSRSHCGAWEHYEYDERTTPLHVAVHRLDASLARLLMDRGAELSARDAKGRTALFQALAADCPADLVLEMLNRGGRAELARADPMNRSYLHSCIAAGHEELTELLLAQPEVDATLRHGSGKTALHFAAEARWESARTARWLLDRGVDVNALDRIHLNSALHLALRSGKSTLAKLLVERGADVNAANRDGLCPLHLAVAESCGVEVLELLISRGADLRRQTPSGQTALHLACHKGREAKVRALLLRGSDPLAEDGVGRSALQMLRPEASGAAWQMIRRLAALRLTEGRQPDERDRRLIDGTAYMQQHLRACRWELARMKKFKVYNNVTLFFVLAASDERLATLARNEDFLAAFESCCVEHKFPVYNDYISLKLKRAVEMMRRSRAVENHLRKILSNHLTHAAIDILSEYVSVEDLPECKL